jgi:hypothetical protein
MKLQKDSLVFRTIVYNDLSMLLTGLTIIGLVVVFAFKELEKNFSIKAVEKFQVIEDMLEIRNTEVIDELTKFVRSDEFLEGNLIISETNQEENLKIYTKLENRIKNRNLKIHDDSKISIISQDGKVLTDDGIAPIFFNTFLEELDDFESKLLAPIGSIMYDNKDEQFYYEIIIPVNNQHNNISAVLVEVPILSSYFQSNKYLMVVNHKDIKEIGIYKDNIPHTQRNWDRNRLKHQEAEIIELNNRKYQVKSLPIDRVDYNIVSSPIYNYLGQKVGYLVLTMAEPDFTKFKINTMSLILLATIILIFINSFVINGTFKQLLKPIEDLSVAVDDIASENLDREVRLVGTSEIKVLGLAIRKLVDKIKQNQFILEDQNEKLKNYIHRVESVEKLLLAVRREPSDDGVIDIVLKGFTSRIGLNYDRAIFLEYNDEKGCLVGKKIRKNRKFL